MIPIEVGPPAASYALRRMQIHALVLAGGSGDRFAAEMPKQFIRLAGEPILLRSLRTVAGAGIEWMFAHAWSVKAEYLYRQAAIAVVSATMQRLMLRWVTRTSCARRRTATS